MSEMLQSAFDAYVIGANIDANRTWHFVALYPDHRIRVEAYRTAIKALPSAICRHEDCTLQMGKLIIHFTSAYRIETIRGLEICGYWIMPWHYKYPEEFHAILKSRMRLTRYVKPVVMEKSMNICYGMPSSWLALTPMSRYLMIRHITGIGPSFAPSERDRINRCVGEMTPKDFAFVVAKVLDNPADYYNSAKQQANPWYEQAQSRLHRYDHCPRPFVQQIDLTSIEKRIMGHLYSSPNGGKRILPSLYTKLKKQWVRSNGQRVDPKDMNVGHLENTLKLLKESHGNAVAKATDLLGRFDFHFGENNGLTEDLKNMCLKMQKIEVDEMYPIFKVLAAELASRKEVTMIMDIETMPYFALQDNFWDYK